MEYPKVRIAFADKDVETVVIDKHDLIECHPSLALCSVISGQLAGNGYILSGSYHWVVLDHITGL